MFSVIRCASKHAQIGRPFSINSKQVAVVLSGSGVFDGSEIHEASATLVHLTRLNYQPVCFAPDVPQMHVIDHSKGAQGKDSRNVLAESARIARGNIKPLTQLKAADVAAAIFPGGFGAAKNLSDFAVNGANLSVNPEVSRVVSELIESKKPLGFMCIAPILAAKLIPGVEVTLGQASGDRWPHADAVQAAKTLGANVVLRNVDQVCIDKNNLVVSTPAFMYDGTFYEIFSGIGLLIETVDALVKNQK